MQKAIIDLSKNGIIPVFHAKQGDTFRRVAITLLDNGLPYDTAADAVSVWYSGPSGEGNYSDGIEKDGSTLTILVNPNMTAASGRHTCAVMLSNESGRCTTWNFCVEVAYTPALGSEEAKAYFEAFEAGELAADIAAVDARTAKAVAELNARVSSIIASGTATEGNTELIDIRTGADGKVYQAAGDAVRGQISELKGDLDKLASYRYADFESNKYINKNGELVELGGWSATPDFISIYDVVNIRLKSEYGAYAISFYGEANENSFISGQIENGYVSVFAPVENAKYVRFCYKDDENAYYAILKNSKYSVINKVKLNGGKYISTNGDIGSHDSWCYSDFYCVNDIEEFSVENNTSGASVISYYDENHLFIGKVDNNIGNITQFENMPLQTKYVRFSFLIASNSYINLKTNIDNSVYNVISKSVLYGKKIVAIGDSMVYGHTLGVDKVWLSEISRIYNMNSLNLGINGATLSRFGGNNPENAVWQRICNPDSSKYISDEVLSDADYVVIFAGTNDYVQNELVGTVETDIRNEWSVIGATNLICQNLQERCPNAKICFITPYNITLGNHENNTFDYVNAIIKGCELNSVPVFNNFTYGGINFYVQNMASDLTMGDGCHLNEKGHKYVSNKYSSFFEQL